MPNKKPAAKKKTVSAAIRGSANIEAVIQAFSANPDAPAIYASSIAILASPIDIVLVLGQLETTPDGANMKKVATVFFSPGHAKQLAILLAQKVAEHEAQFGEISPPFFAALKAAASTQ